MFSDMPCICIPIVSNSNKHPSEVDLVGMFLHFIDGSTRFINFEHPDMVPFDGNVKDIVLHPKSLVLNKKTLLYFGLDWGIDLNSFMQYYLDEIISPVDYYSKTMEHYDHLFHMSNNLSKIIPLSKWIEYCNGISNVVSRYFKPDLISDKCISYCQDYTRVFHSIERNTIPYGDENRHQNYWWYTATSRPSNAWNSFNFSALNKRDGTRDKIHSRFDGGKLVQFDYDAFHIKLLAKILGYSFTEHPYLQLKTELNLTDDYDHVKTRIFQNIYGGITDEFMRHDFFQAIQAIIDELYYQYTDKGYIESWFYGKRFRDLDDPNPNKLFNYFLQSLETEYNVKKIEEILKILAGKQTTLALYLWDAFVFDVHPDEVDLIPILKSLFETDAMTVKIAIGDNFGDMLQS